MRSSRRFPPGGDDCAGDRLRLRPADAGLGIPPPSSERNRLGLVPAPAPPSSSRSRDRTRASTSTHSRPTTSSTGTASPSRSRSRCPSRGYSAPWWEVSRGWPRGDGRAGGPGTDRRIVASKGSRPRLRDMMLQAGVIRRRGHPDQNRLHSTSAHRDPTHRICTYYSSALPDPPGRRPDSSPRAFSRIDETRPNHSSPSRGVISQTSPLRPSEGDDIARPSARPPVRGSIRRCSSRGSGVARQAGPRPCDLALPHRRSDASPTREARPGGPRPIFRRLERRPSP